MEVATAKNLIAKKSIANALTMVPAVQKNASVPIVTIKLTLNKIRKTVIAKLSCKLRKKNR